MSARLRQVFFSALIDWSCGSVIEFCSGQYTLMAALGALPPIYDHYVRNADLHEDLGIRRDEGKPAFVAVKRNGSGWPHLALSLRRRGIAGFPLGALIVPETDLLLIGSDETLLAYDLTQPRRLWEDYTFAGFWGWQRHDDILLMVAECELAAYSLQGHRLWSEPTEPPWTYAIVGDRLDLDVMGKPSVLSMHEGRQP